MAVKNNLENILSLQSPAQHLAGFQQDNRNAFAKWEIPALKHEEWKYTRIRNAFREDLSVDTDAQLDIEILKGILLPGTETANRIVFVNGKFTPSLGHMHDDSSSLIVKSLDQAAGDEDADFVKSNLGHSQRYHPDGINALNGTFAAQGAYIRVKKGKALLQPVIIIHINGSKAGYKFSQPRLLVNVEEGAEVQLIASYHNLGGESFTNEVTEICAAKDAVLHYVKLQNEGTGSTHVGTTHIRQLGKSLTHAVTITLSGDLVRNNLNMVMEAEHGESHMYGLYLLGGETVADNHTIVDNAMPHCYSNELYKGIMDASSTGVFNGKIFVRKDAQKTNAYQSNKNILIGENASANTKPQLEILADDVKCSHGCTIGKLDEDALFYLRARGISEHKAKAILLHAFAIDILDQIKHAAIRQYADRIVSERLSFEYNA